MASIENIIVAHPFWQGLDPGFVPLLAESATLLHFGVGEVIFQERLAADHLYLLHRGQVALEMFVPGRGLITLQVVPPGEALGWSWLFPPYLWQVTAKSIDTTEVLAFSAASLRAKAEAHPAFGRELVTRTAQVLLHRLQATRLKLQEFYDPGVGKDLDECLKTANDEPDADTTSP